MLTRLVPLLLVAVGAFAFGLHEALSSGADARATARSYVHAWQLGDFAAMYRKLDPASRRSMTESAFAGRYASAVQLATLRSLVPGQVSGPSNGIVGVRVLVHTRVFGSFWQTLQVPIASDGGHVRFASTLMFPGLRGGEQLRRRTELGPRGTILASDGTPLAEGPQRTSTAPDIAGEIVGTLGSVPADERARYVAAGYPSNALVGLSGLELVFQRRLAGRIGGTLLAGGRVLAHQAPRPGRTVRTTIEPAVERAAINALGGSYAGMTVIDPRSGAVLALAGIAYSAVQPPGSTFKIITAAAALRAGIATLASQYPVQTNTSVDGFNLQNAGGEACGGSLVEAFAVSCDTVFAPLGLQIGAQRLVHEAQLFGFDHPPGIPGALESTIPTAATIGDGAAVGASAIGQGQVQASTLEMAVAAATIADGGRRPIPTLLAGARPRFVHVTSPTIAHEVQQMMEAVVEYGTGMAAQIPGVQVAGKTGTAELANTANQKNNKAETDGWFVGYAPVGAAKVVACALFPSAGYGATSAAPAVQQVLVAALAGSG